MNIARVTDPPPGKYVFWPQSSLDEKVSHCKGERTADYGLLPNVGQPLQLVRVAVGRMNNCYRALGRHVPALHETERGAFLIPALAVE